MDHFLAGRADARSKSVWDGLKQAKFNEARRLRRVKSTKPAKALNELRIQTEI